MEQEFAIRLIWALLFWGVLFWAMRDWRLRATLFVFPLVSVRAQVMIVACFLLMAVRISDIELVERLKRKILPFRPKR